MDFFEEPLCVLPCLVFAGVATLLGTFQVTVAPADSGGTFMFATSAILCAGRIREKPAVVNHEIVARPMMTISCCADHRVWNGITVSRFLKGVKKRLESELH